MAIGDKYRASIVTNVAGIDCVNVLHFEQMAPDGAEVPADSLKAALETILLPVWVPMLAPSVAIASVIIKKILPAPDQPFSYTFAGGTGTNAGGNTMPPNIAVVLSIYTNDNTRKGRGRNYISGIDEAEVLETSPKASLVTLFSTFITTLLGGIVDGGSAINWAFRHFSPTLNSTMIITHIEQRMQLRVLRGRTVN